MRHPLHHLLLVHLRRKEKRQKLQKARAVADGENALAGKLEAEAREQRAAAQAKEAKFAKAAAAEAEKQKEQLNSKFVQAKQDFLSATNRDGQRAAMAELFKFKPGQDYVMEVLERGTDLHPTLKLQAMGDIIQQTAKDTSVNGLQGETQAELLSRIANYPSHYNRTMAMLPMAIHDHSVFKNGFEAAT